MSRSMAAEKAASKPLRGIFPIAQTPFTTADALDLETLVEEVKFIDRGGVHGFVWPQIASEWATLTEQERHRRNGGHRLDWEAAAAGHRFRRAGPGCGSRRELREARKDYAPTP